MIDTYNFNLCTVVVKHDEKWIGTIFKDGQIAHARPNYTDDDWKRCADLGYGKDIWQMNVDHELFHTATAEMAGEPYSQVLWEAAHGTVFRMDIEAAYTEEDRVFDAQRNQPEELIKYIQARKEV